jgi:hypothetical protein
VDLTGQVCADSIGPKLYSGVGGQLDFVYGASRSKGGVPIIALPSTAVLKDGTLISRIVSMLKHGAGVVTSRNHVLCRHSIRRADCMARLSVNAQVFGQWRIRIPRDLITGKNFTIYKPFGNSPLPWLPAAFCPWIFFFGLDNQLLPIIIRFG